MTDLRSRYIALLNAHTGPNRRHRALFLQRFDEASHRQRLAILSAADPSAVRLNWLFESIDQPGLYLGWETIIRAALTADMSKVRWVKNSTRECVLFDALQFQSQGFNVHPVEFK